jgi:hypothetical protein
MLRQISWSSYFEFIVTISIIYYAVVILIYNRNSIMKILWLKSQQTNSIRAGVVISGNEKISDAEIQKGDTSGNKA